MGLYLQYKIDASHLMIEIRLREAMGTFRRRTGERLTYHDLATRTGLSRATLESMASRRGYNASLASIDKLCEALQCELNELLSRKCDKGRGNDRS